MSAGCRGWRDAPPLPDSFLGAHHSGRPRPLPSVSSQQALHPSVPLPGVGAGWLCPRTRAGEKPRLTVCIPESLPTNRPVCLLRRELLQKAADVVVNVVSGSAPTVPTCVRLSSRTVTFLNFLSKLNTGTTGEGQLGCRVCLDGGEHPPSAGRSIVSQVLEPGQSPSHL